jgi:hypothetical protein
MAGDLGFGTIVVADAIAAREGRSYDGAFRSAETAHELALANLREGFATILSTDQVLGGA